MLLSYERIRANHWFHHRNLQNLVCGARQLCQVFPKIEDRVVVFENCVEQNTHIDNIRLEKNSIKK